MCVTELDGFSVLHILTMSDVPVYKDPVTMAHLLIERKARVDIVSKVRHIHQDTNHTFPQCGDTAFDLAVAGDQLTMVRCLLSLLLRFSMYRWRSLSQP